MDLLKADPLWSKIGIKSKADFERVVPAPVRAERLPETVQTRFEVLHKLIDLSYYAHELLDVALEYALVSLELALKVRYEELTTTSSEHVHLRRLIEWAKETNLLDDPQVADGLRQLRNELLHPRYHQRFAIMVPDLLGRVLDTTDSLYDDPFARAHRAEIEARINACLEAVSRRGGVLVAQGQSHDVVLGRLLHVDLAVDPKVYYVLFWPTFDPAPRDDTVDWGKPIIVASTSFDEAESGVQFTMQRAGVGDRAVLTLKPAGDRAHDEWRARFAASPFPLRIGIDAEIARRRNEIRWNVGGRRRAGRLPT